MANESPSILTPLVIAAMGLVPLALMASGTSAPETVVEQIQPVEQVVREVPVATTAPATTAANSPTEVVITTPAPVITGVSDEVARVLAAQGFSAEEQVAGLPDSVVALLRDRGVVLTIAVEGGS